MLEENLHHHQTPSLSPAQKEDKDLNEKKKAVGSDISWFETRYLEADVEGSLLFQNALVLIEEKEIQLGEEILRTLLEKDNHCLPVIYWLMQCALRKGELKQARVTARALLSIKKDFHSCYFLANAYYLESNDTAALTYYREALDQYFFDSDILFEIYKNIGNILTRQGDLESAEEAYFKSYSLKPKSDALLVNMATLELQKTQIESAKRYFREAIGINRENDRAWAGLALIHKSVGDFELSKANAEYSLDLNPLNKVAIQIYLEWSAQNDSWEHVEERLKDYLAADGMDLEISFALSKVLVRQKKWQEAKLETSRYLILGGDEERGLQLNDLIRMNSPKREIEIE